MQQIPLFETTNALDVSFHCSDLDETVTVREYLKRLLTTLIEEEEGFSGKRPFGNSGWLWDVYGALIASGHLEGKIDKEGFIESIADEKYAKEYVINLVKTLQ